MDDALDLDAILDRLGQMDPYARAQFNVAALQVRVDKLQQRLAPYEQPTAHEGAHT